MTQNGSKSGSKRVSQNDPFWGCPKKALFLVKTVKMGFFVIFDRRTRNLFYFCAFRSRAILCTNRLKSEIPEKGVYGQMVVKLTILGVPTPKMTLFEVIFDQFLDQLEGQI